MTTSAATGPNYGSLIVEALTRYPTREAFVLGDRRVTYAETADTTARIVRVMQDHGMRRGCLSLQFQWPTGGERKFHHHTHRTQVL